MKKIIIIIAILFSTGCADYKELDGLSYVTGIGVNYVDGTYVATFEIMENKTSNGSIETYTYTSTGEDKSLYKAMVNASTKLNKTAYFMHTQVFILSSNIENDQLHEVADTIIRNPKLNEEFLLVMTDEDPGDILNLKSETNKSSAFYLYSLIKENDYSANEYVDNPFAAFTEKLMDKNIDPLVSVISLDDDEIIINKAISFNNYKKATNILLDEVNLFNAINYKENFIPMTIKVNGKTVDLSLRIADHKIDIKKDEIKINLEAVSEIKKSDKDLNMKNDDVYVQIEKEISNKLEKRLRDLIISLQKNKSDIFGFSNLFYINTRLDNKDLWTTANININVDTLISRKGIIYNVN